MRCLRDFFKLSVYGKTIVWILNKCAQSPWYLPISDTVLHQIIMDDLTMITCMKDLIITATSVRNPLTLQIICISVVF